MSKLAHRKVWWHSDDEHISGWGFAESQFGRSVFFRARGRCVHVRRPMPRDGAVVNHDRTGERILAWLALLALAGAGLLIATSARAPRPMHDEIAPGVTAAIYLNKEQTP